MKRWTQVEHAAKSHQPQSMRFRTLRRYGSQHTAQSVVSAMLPVVLCYFNQQ
jgi:hypothetical protein